MLRSKRVLHCPCCTSASLSLIPFTSVRHLTLPGSLGHNNYEVCPGKKLENQFSVELYEAWAWKRTWATSGGRGVCCSCARTGMECRSLACALARGSSGATLSGRVIPLSQSASFVWSALLEVSSHSLCRYGCLQHACSVSLTSAFPPLVPTRSFWIAGRFSVQLRYPSSRGPLREETTPSNINLPIQIAMDDRRCRGEQLARKTTLRGSQLLPPSSPVSRFQPLYK